MSTALFLRGLGQQEAAFRQALHHAQQRGGDLGRVCADLAGGLLHRFTQEVNGLR